MNIQQIRCADIVVRKRYRKDNGEISPLADSMKSHGLLQPIMVRADNLNLIFGARRLMAAKRLKWATITCILVQPDALDSLVAEQDENTQRKEFSHSEKVAIAQAIIEREREKAKERKDGNLKQNTPNGKIFRSDQTSEKPLFSEESEFPEKQPEGRAKDIAAAAVGMSRPTLEKATEVVEAAEADPALQPIVEKMDETGNVSGAHREMEEKTGGKADKPTYSKKPAKWNKEKWKKAFGAFQRACDGVKLMSRKTRLGCTVSECLDAILTASKGA